METATVTGEVISPVDGTSDNEESDVDVSDEVLPDELLSVESVSVVPDEALPDELLSVEPVEALPVELPSDILPLPSVVPESDVPPVLPLPASALMSAAGFSTA